MSDFHRVMTRRLFRVVNGGTPRADAEFWGGEVAWATPIDLGVVHGRVLTATGRTLTRAGLETGSRAVPAGSLLLSTRAPIGYVSEAGTTMAFNQGCRGLVPQQELDSRFYRYTFVALADELSSYGQGSTFFELPSDSLAEFPIPLPNLREQRAIADFLDVETARIDALIEKKRRMIKLLNQRLSSLVDAWLRDLLATAKLLRVQHLVEERDDRLGVRKPPQLLVVSIHQGVLPRHEFTNDVPRADELTAYKMVRKGDIVLNRMRAFQGGVGRAPEDGIVSPDYTVLRPLKNINDLYLHYIARSTWFVGEMTARLRGIGGSEQGNVRTPRVNFSDLKLIEIPVPTIRKQKTLANDMERDGRIASLAARRLERQIELLTEHRQALITATVTGQLEVSGG